MVENRALAYWSMTVLYACMIFYFSSQSTPPEPVASAARGMDLPLHFLEYTGFSLLLYLSLRESMGHTRYTLMMLVFGVTLYGGLDELHQGFVPGRTTDLRDLGADVLASIAVALGAESAYRLGLSDHDKRQRA